MTLWYVNLGNLFRTKCLYFLKAITARKAGEEKVIQKQKQNIDRYKPTLIQDFATNLAFQDQQFDREMLFFQGNPKNFKSATQKMATKGNDWGSVVVSTDAFNQKLKNDPNTNCNPRLFIPYMVSSRIFLIEFS